MSTTAANTTATTTSYTMIRFVRAAIIVVATSSFMVDAFSTAPRIITYRPMIVNPLSLSSSATSTAEDSAKALTDYMAKAHEEKLRAMSEVESKFKTKIAELEAKVAELESVVANGNAMYQTSDNSFAMPATNQMMTEKVAAYQKFVSDYIVSSQLEKTKAVEEAEKKIAARYEAKIAEMQK